MINPQQMEKAQIMSPMKQVSFALSVSLLNPHAILDTIGVIGSSAALYSGSNKIAFTIACISVFMVMVLFTRNFRKNGWIN